MNLLKLISTVVLFCSSVAFTSCNNHNQETPEKNVMNTTTTGSDSSQSSSDSVSRGTTVRPETPSTTPKP